MLDEADLIARARGEDAAAISQLLAHYGPQVRALLAPELGPVYRPYFDLDDIMQVTYLEAVQRIHGFELRNAGAFLPWLTRIARNNLRDAIRGVERSKRLPPRRRVAAHDPDEQGAALLDRLAAVSSTPSRQLRRQESIALLKKAIAGLPESYLRVVQLLDLEGMPAQEAAAQLERSLGAVYMLHARALDRLRDLIGREFDSHTGCA